MGRQLLAETAREMAALAVGFGVVLGATEAILRAFDDFGRMVPAKIAALEEKSQHPLWAGRPWRPLEFIVPIVKNAEGYHAAEFTRQEGRPIRVAVLGDSFVKALQVPAAESFVSQAQSLLPGVQLLSLGEDGQFFPLLLPLFRDKLPQLFGPGGKYPALHAVIFCVEEYSLVVTAKGDRQLAVSLPTHSWRYRYKEPVTLFAQAVVRKGMRSRLHSVSYYSDLANSWLDSDLKARMLPPPDAVNLERAAEVLEKEVVGPMAALCRERGLACGFMYVPNAHEILDIDESGPERRHFRRLFEQSGLPWVDATPYFRGEEDGTYFPFDKHPTTKGHGVFARALRDLVARLLAPHAASGTRETDVAR